MQDQLGEGAAHFGIPRLTADELAGCESIASRYRIAKRFRRIYHIHVRKTAGTSVNHSFYALGGGDPASTYQSLLDSPKRVFVRNSLIFVAGNEHAINEGHYFYASSHIPAYRLALPKLTFTVATLRDPLARVISHYQMLLQYQQALSVPDWITPELEWLGSTIRNFLDAIPKESLLNQLHMFSANFDVDEAADYVRRLTHWFLVERFDDGLARLGEKVQIKLARFHVRQSAVRVEIPPRDLAYLRDLLSPEYALLRKLCP
jgi:hypothetical protein